MIILLGKETCSSLHVMRQTWIVRVSVSSEEDGWEKNNRSGLESETRSEIVTRNTISINLFSHFFSNNIFEARDVKLIIGHFIGYWIKTIFWHNLKTFQHRKRFPCVLDNIYDALIETGLKNRHVVCTYLRSSKTF